MQREGDREKVRPANRPVDRDVPESRRLAAAAKAAFRTVFDGWDTAPDSGVERAIPAQIAAAALGYKPLYWDPWDEGASGSLARLIRPSLPPGAQVRAAPEGLFVFRPDVVSAILDSDPSFYRPAGEAVFPAGRRATRMQMNGELLGYGARTLRTVGAARATIRGNRGDILVHFVSLPKLAIRSAEARAEDLTTVLADVIEIVIEYPPFSDEPAR